MTEIIFALHGKTDNNDLGILQGHLDSPLNEEGLRDARKLASEIAKIDFDILISSDLQRAKDCANRIAKETGKRIFIEPLLRERSMGVHQGVKITDIGYNNLSYNEMVRHLYECDCPCGENNLDLIDRVKKFLEKVSKIRINKVEFVINKVCLKKATLTSQGPIYEDLFVVEGE